MHVIQDFYEENGYFPEPDNGRLPKSLLFPKNYLTKSYENVTPWPVRTDILPVDLFSDESVENNNNTFRGHKTRPIKMRGLPLRYGVTSNSFVLACNGPDGKPDIDVNNLPEDLAKNSIYDITNGTISDGDLVSWGRDNK